LTIIDVYVLVLVKSLILYSLRFEFATYELCLALLWVLT